MSKHATVASFTDWNDPMPLLKVEISLNTGANSNALLDNAASLNIISEGVVP